MTKILVSGAGGYVGTIMCEELLKKDFKVYALDRFFFGIDKLHHLDCDNLFIIKDDIRYFDEKILKNIDIVIDLAGLSNDATSEINSNFTKEINCEGSIRLANLAKKTGVKHYIYSSSASVYGYGHKSLLKETDKLNPITAYAKSKITVEKELLELYDKKFNVTILRNSTIYGLSPRMRFDLAVNNMTMRGWKEGTIYIIGKGQQWRPFVHIKDVVNAFILSLSKPEDASGQIFNVGNKKENYQIKDLAFYISSLMVGTKTIYIPSDADTRSYNLSFDKINKKLDYTTLYSVKDGVNEIKQALDSGIITYDDPTAITLEWYQNLISWDKKIDEIKMYNKIL